MKQHNREAKQREAARLEEKRRDRGSIAVPVSVAASSTDPDYGAKVEAKPKTKRERERDKRIRKAKAHTGREVASHYWLTPKASTRHCSHCSAVGCIAVRPRDGKAACSACVARLGINAHESASWREAGGKPHAPVIVRFVDPETLRAAR